MVSTLELPFGGTKRSGYGRELAALTGEAKSYAERLEHEQPKLITSRMTKAVRTGRVFIDWSQNNGKKTTVAPYSLRAREHPTVSTPVTWDEVAACTTPADLTFTADDLPARLATHGDLFAPLLPPPHH